MPPRPHPLAYLSAFFLLFALPLVLSHLPLLGLPYFWDEAGQFIPTALDLWRDGAWVAHSTLPNVHPPGVEAYLAVWYSLAGYSIVVTRIAMLLGAALGVWLTFLLGVELTAGMPGAPAFWPPLLLLASPLFYMQSFMAQLDMPAMVLTLAALYCFLDRRYAVAAFVSLLLVWVKETAIVTPLVFFLLLFARREWKRSLYFVLPALGLGGWLLVLHHATSYWLGNPEFAHYNVGYALHPVRMLLTFARRLYYLFFAEFRFVGTLIILIALRRRSLLRGDAWRVALLVAAANLVIVSALGGAELERYLLPILPIFYIAVAAALSTMRQPIALLLTAVLLVGLVVNLFWNPPYPFPYENNWAMVDFVRLQQAGAQYAEQHLTGKTIATAWPYTTALRNPDFGYVRHPFRTVETSDFNNSSIAAIAPRKFDVLMTYTRTWAPEDGWLRIAAVREFLAKFYAWEPPISEEQCRELGLAPTVRWVRRGQTLTIYQRR